ncbi:MAG TPA: MlaD family protein [Thermodesulfobacteriota bacterium]|nr:MlaD family protein [Thermodesulfobacteriota bacterium]
MEKLSAETKVGIFVFAGFVLLVYMSLRVGGIQFRGEEGYTLFVRVENASGLDKDASVRIAGVEAGRITDISLDNNMARLTLKIKPEMTIGKDFVAVLKTKGLLGEKYLELLPGAPGATPLRDGDEITRTLTYADMDKLVSILSDVATDVKGVTESLNNVLGGQEGETTLRNIVTNIEDITFRLDNMLAKNEDNVTTAVQNFAELSSTLKEAAASIKDILGENRENIKQGIENLKTASLKLDAAMTNLNQLSQDLSPELKETVASIKNVARKIDKGEGTIGKLINDDATHEKLNKTLSGINSYIERGDRIKMFLAYRAEYLFDPNEVKNYFSIKIQPKADKYYLIEIIDDPRGKRKVDTVEITTGGVTTTTEKVKTSDQIKLSAQIAKRIKDVVIRGGVIESAGGAGIDYYLWKDRIKLSFEASDFDKKRGTHIKAGATLNLGKYIFLTAGYDDPATKLDLASSYAGLGFQFEDDDLKYIFSSAPPMQF